MQRFNAANMKRMAVKQIKDKHFNPCHFTRADVFQFALHGNDLFGGKPTRETWYKNYEKVNHMTRSDIWQLIVHKHDIFGCIPREDWAKMFTKCDINRNGRLEENEFELFVEETMKIYEATLEDEKMENCN